MRVLVTGGSGFLGSHVVEQLSAAGHQVVALVRKTSNTKFLAQLDNVTLAIGSIEDRASLDDAVQGVNAVVHSAGLVKARTPEEFFQVNVQGSENLALAIKAQGASDFRRFVLISSLAAVGPSEDGRPVDPNDRRAVTHYGRSKRQAEDSLLEHKDDLPLTILRPPMIYGPRDNESFAFFQSVSRGVLPKIGDGANTLSVIYASDAASACIAALTSTVPSGSTYFIDDGRIYDWSAMLDDIESALGKRARLRFGVPFPLLRLAATASEAMGKVTGKAVMLTRDKVNELTAPHWVCDSSDAQRELNWTPQVQWSEGTRRAAAWYKREGWL